LNASLANHYIENFKNFAVYYYILSKNNFLSIGIKMLKTRHLEEKDYKYLIKF